MQSWCAVRKRGQIEGAKHIGDGAGQHAYTCCLQAVWRDGGNGSGRIPPRCLLGQRLRSCRWRRCWAACRWMTPRCRPPAAHRSCSEQVTDLTAAVHRLLGAQHAACLVCAHSQMRSGQTGKTTQTNSLCRTKAYWRCWRRCAVSLRPSSRCWAPPKHTPAGTRPQLRQQRI
jgi:hypothetical protein